MVTPSKRARLDDSAPPPAPTEEEEDPDAAPPASTAGAHAKPLAAQHAGPKGVGQRHDSSQQPSFESVLANLQHSGE